MVEWGRKSQDLGPFCNKLSRTARVAAAIQPGRPLFGTELRPPKTDGGDGFDGSSSFKRRSASVIFFLVTEQHRHTKKMRGGDVRREEGRVKWSRGQAWEE